MPVLAGSAKTLIEACGAHTMPAWRQGCAWICGMAEMRWQAI